MDIFSHIFVVKNCNVCLKRLKINEKEARVGPFKKKQLPRNQNYYFAKERNSDRSKHKITSQKEKNMSRHESCYILRFK